METFTITEVAKRLGIPRPSVDNWVRPTVYDGSPPKIKATKKNGKWRIPEAEVDRLRVRLQPVHVIIDGKSAVKLPLGVKNDKFAIIDEEDLNRVLKCSKRWHVGGPRGYAHCSGGHSLHRVIKGDLGKLEIDHINGDTFDNRKCNLRFATRTQNAQNSTTGRVSRVVSRFKGVTKNRAGSWEAKIRAFGEQIYLGVYADEVAAAKVYDAAAHKYHKEFARLNFSYPSGPPDLDMLVSKQRRVRGSGPKGVYFHKKSGKFVARVKLHGKLKHVGLFRTEGDAIIARDAFLKSHPKYLA